MDLLYSLLLGFVSVVLINNLVFTKFLGICPYIGVSGRIDMAFGMGLAVTFVMTLSGSLTWMIDHWLLMPLGLEVARYVTFIMVIAAAVQLVEMYLKRFFPPLYESFGIFLPLITTNCAILGLCLFLVVWGTGTLIEAIVLSFGGGIGFTIAICIMAGIRENMQMVDVPQSLQGAPITLITAGLLALAFMGFAGMI
ncbi:MAG TPA: RnfABCDGE type electron transport complex subunit A [Sedimentisphaerales bacterium]|nr:RnfABCDGE type electron transport complex subunit A [Phycisphaerae bacterium]HOV77310.1 RnfABCDGE type electron transport complex subunit A [Sedimentisphaerales bacterium]